METTTPEIKQSKKPGVFSWVIYGTSVAAALFTWVQTLVKELTDTNKQIAQERREDNKELVKVLYQNNITTSNLLTLVRDVLKLKPNESNNPYDSTGLHSGASYYGGGGSERPEPSK